MSEKLSCYVVKDLLPLMADGLTGEETSQDIKSHLETCEDCRRAYEAMVGAEQNAQQEQKEQDIKQIDYLKKVRKRGKRATLIVGCAALAVLAVLGWRFFIRGGVDEQLEMSAFVKKGSDREVVINAAAFGSAVAGTGIDVAEKDGVVTVSGRTAIVGIRKNNELSRSYTASSEVKQIVDASGRVLWENGMVIEAWTGRLYANRVKYVGNASAVSNLKNLIWTPTTDMPYGPMELYTASEPYGVHITIGSEDIALSDELIAYLKETANRHACLMLALVENLGYAEYTINTGRKDASGQQLLVAEQSMTADEALKFAQGLAATLPYGNASANAVLEATSIKDLAKSAYSLQQLADVLHLGVQKDVVYGF